MAALDRGEINLAQELERGGLSHSASVLAVVMATRGHARPDTELVEIVRQYPGLESPVDTRRAIQELLSKKWIEQTDSDGKILTHQAPNLRDLIALAVGGPNVAKQLSAMRANLEPLVRVLGAMNDKRVYLTFMKLLSSAQQEICLPMLVTPPYEETVKILRERADAGVRVRILLGVPSLVAKWRGETMRSVAEERIRQWVNYFQDRKTVEVRLCGVPEYMEVATCVSVDRSVVRFDIYDPYHQRSLEGVLVEVLSPQGIMPNLVRLFQRVFEDAWSRSIGTRRYSRIYYPLRRWWKLWLTIGVILAAFLPVNVAHWSEIVIGIGCGIGAPFVLEEVPKAYRVVQGWRAS